MKKNINSEDGFALVTALIMLVVLAFIGKAVTDLTIMELKISGNERVASQRFYAVDSGWKQGGPFLNNRAAPPTMINRTKRGADQSINWADAYYRVVRNFGEGADTIVNDAFPANSQDGTISNVPYWYRVVYENDIRAEGYGEDTREFQFAIDCSAAGTLEVATQLTRVFKVGY